MNKKLTTRINALLDSEDPSVEQELYILSELVILGVQEPDFGEVAAGPISEYLDSGDPSILVDFMDFIGAIAGPEVFQDSDSATAEIAVMCADDDTRPNSESLIPLIDRFNAISDLFAEIMVGQASMCAGWPAAVEPLRPIAADTAPVSIVIGGTTDALTPLNWGQRMAQAIGGVFVESHHLGHTTLFQGTSLCVDNIVTRYLLKGFLPENAICQSEEE